MAARDPRSRGHVLVVGDGHHDLVGQMVRLAGECGLAATRCDDIYSATAELARHPGRFLMVTGAFRHLARGQCDFFALARRHEVPCCCLMDRGSGVERDTVLAAARLGVRLAGATADIREFIESRLDPEGNRLADAGERDLRHEEFRATEDELRALLGETHG